MNERTDRILANADAVTARKAVLRDAAAMADRLGSALRATPAAALDEAKVRDLLADVDAIGDALAVFLPAPSAEEIAAVAEVVDLEASPDIVPVAAPIAEPEPEPVAEVTPEPTPIPRARKPKP